MGNKQVSDIRYSYYIHAEKERKGETRVMRCPKLKPDEPLGLRQLGFDSLVEIFEHSAVKFPHNNFLGTRVKTDGTLSSSYHWKTYAQAHKDIINLSKGLIQLGLFSTFRAPEDGIELRFLAFLSKNRPEYTIADFAAQYNSITSVPLYETLGISAMQHMCAHTQVTTICCSGSNIEKICQYKKTGICKMIDKIISFDQITDSQINKCIQVGIELYYIWDVAKAGEESDLGFLLPKSEDVALISYTSGSTGIPKGVMLTHKNFLTALTEISDTFNESDVTISYLPMAHIFERLILYSMVYLGASLGSYSGDVLKLVEDMQILKPTIIPFVPRLLIKIHDNIQAKLQSVTRVKKKMLDYAIATKLDNLKRGQYTHSIWDKLIFNKLKGIVGGRIRHMITGSAALTSEVRQFMQIAFCANLSEAYGQTESTGCGTSTSHLDSMPDYVGGPLSVCEIKLIDVPSMNYLATDTPNPRGEICIRGNSLFKGYFRDPKATREAIDEEGWLHTGDVGEILPNGALKIIDRIKSIFKLSQGEYIVPLKLENLYSKSKYVSQLFIHGDNTQSYVIAIVVPDEIETMLWARTNGVEGEFIDVAKNPQLKKVILEDMIKLGKQAEFNSLELIKKLHICEEPFTVENDLLTPTMKVKRFEARKKFAKIIEDLYSDR